VAFALTEYLNAEGLSTGFDVNLDGLIWMMRHLPEIEARFRVVLADVHNTEYRLDASAPAAGKAFIPFDESINLGWIAAAELTVAGPMQEGSWSNGDPSRELQDVLLLRRTGA
jgi:hypothetical protein